MKKEEMNCEIILGFNTKQLWIYDNTNDVYIDPPKDVLDEIENKFGTYINWNTDQNIKEVENYLLDLVNKKPDWLYETDYWYNGEDIEI